VLGEATVVAFVGSEDRAASERFCRGVLGLKLIESSPYACVHEVRGTILRVTRVELAARAPYTVLDWAVEDIAAAAKWLRARAFRSGATAGSNRTARRSGTRVAWFEDPDANTFSLTQLPTI
jgi:catechol 2,3-dioxygenase-like lactoylglutathione lyase family enzyme